MSHRLGVPPKRPLRHARDDDRLGMRRQARSPRQFRRQGNLPSRRGVSPHAQQGDGVPGRFAAGAALALDNVPIDVLLAVTGGVNPRMDGEACAGEEKGAAEAPGLFNGMAVQSDGLSVVSSV